jgi:hypothetical protein
VKGVCWLTPITPRISLLRELMVRRTILLPDFVLSFLTFYSLTFTMIHTCFLPLPPVAAPVLCQSQSSLLHVGALAVACPSGKVIVTARRRRPQCADSQGDQPTRWLSRKQRKHFSTITCAVPGRSHTPNLKLSSFIRESGATHGQRWHVDHSTCATCASSPFSQHPRLQGKLIFNDVNM